MEEQCLCQLYIAKSLVSSWGKSEKALSSAAAHCLDELDKGVNSHMKQLWWSSQAHASHPCGIGAEVRYEMLGH